MENSSTLWQKINNKIDRLSNLAFDKRFIPFTIILVFILLGTYLFLFYRWFFPSSIPLSSNPQTGARVLLTQVQQKSTQPNLANIDISIDTSIIQGSMINGLQIVAGVSGNVPEDITFSPRSIPGLETVIATFDHENNQLLLKIGYLTPPGETYVIESSKMDLGSISFTKPSSGAINFDFSPTLNKILEPKSLNNLLVQPESQSYAF